jgi:peptidoglycan-N-acetylglucosamine deacetylase
LQCINYNLLDNLLTIKQMMPRIILTLITLFISGFFVSAQSYQALEDQDNLEFAWPEGKKMALSLTFDDARLSQADTGIPLFDRYDVKATFYISPGSMLERLDIWKGAVDNGHEIGNHSMVHPCSGNFQWSRSRALENYTLYDMETELDSASRFIKEYLGVYPVSFAYPCGQTFVGRGINTKSYVPLVASMFDSGRGWLDGGPNDAGFTDMAQLRGVELDGKSFDQIIPLIEEAKKSGGWLILAGHEIGSGGRQTSLTETIEAILQYATDPANGIWIDSVGRIASYVIETRPAGF